MHHTLIMRDVDAPLLQKKLGLVIRELRQQLGFSQESFADHIGIHRTYIGGIERGERNVSLQNLVRIADALAIPLSTLIGLAEAKIV